MSQTALLDSKLEYAETAELVSRYFAWNPGVFCRAAIRVLSKLMQPLEYGSCNGRSLDGEPHRTGWVIAGPLTLFALERGGRISRAVLAARLRHSGEINLFELDLRKRGKIERKPAAKEFERFCETGLAPAGVDGGPGCGERSVLDIINAIQMQSGTSLKVIPVARTSHQITPDAPASSMTVKAYRLAPWSAVRKAGSLFRLVRTGGLKNCKPVVLSDWQKDNGGASAGAGDLGRRLRLDLMSMIESEHRACAGPPLEPVWEVKRRVLADPLLTAYMQEYGLEEGKSRDQVRRESQGYIEEIASDYRVGVVRWFARCVDFLFNKFMDGIDVDRHGIRYLSECDSRNRIVLVCSHKSYLDPLLIGYAMFRSGLVPPHQAAGLNLSFWPVGWLLRHSGAFYLRRTFNGETLYREVFCAYVRYLLAENYISVVYIEGTRSRDGKLGRPKLGYLGILAESLRMGVCSDINLVPVYLGYDKVPEESSHVREMAGGGKIKESVKGFVRIYRAINTRLGRAYVKFGTPHSLKRLLENHDLQGAAEVVCREIQSVTPVTSRCIASSCLLVSGGERVSRREVERCAGALVGYCERNGVPLKADLRGVIEAAERLSVEGRVVTGSIGGENGYVVAGGDRRFLEYNKNIGVHHFAGPAIASICGGQQDDIRFLKEILSLEATVTDGIPDPPDDPEAARVFASLLRPTLEGYYTALLTLEEMGSDFAVGLSELLENCFRNGGGLLEEGRLTGAESLSRVTFRRVLKKLGELKVVSESREADSAGETRTTIRNGSDVSLLGDIVRRVGSILG